MADRENVNDNSQVNLQVQPQPQQQLQVHPQPQQQLQVHPQPQQQLQVQPQQQLQVQPQQQLQVQPQQQLHVQPQQQLHVQPELQLQSQPVRDLPGLLRAVTSIRGAAGTTNTEHSEMSAENQQWLMNALGELCCPSDDVQLMKQALALLEVEMSSEKEESRSGAKNEEDEDVEEWDERVQRQERALDTLLEITEVVDYSRVDFCKLGGMNVVFTGPLLSSAPSLRHRAAELVATCAQNEPMVQSCVLSLGGLQTLLDLVDKDTNEVVRVKALFAVSCIVRESEVALHEFVEKDGCSLLLRSLQNESPRLRAKAAFLVHCLLRTRPHLQEDFIAMGTVQQLGMMLQDFHEPSHEHIAGALCCLASHPMGLAGCQESALGLEHILRSRISELGTNDQFQEEKEFCEHLMEIFAADTPSNGAMDR